MTSKMELSFRINHPSISPHEITKEIGITSSDHAICGENRILKDGTRLEYVYKKHYWSYRIDVSKHSNLVDAIKSLNNELIDHYEYIKEISATGGQVEYLIGISSNENHVEIFSTEVIDSCSKCGIQLSVCFYPQ